MSLSVSSSEFVAAGREKLLDLRDFVVVSYFRLRAAPHAGRAVMASLVLVGGLGAGFAAVRHHFHHHPSTVALATTPDVENAAPATTPPVVAEAPAAPAPALVAVAPVTTPKLDMRVTGAIPPVDEPVKKKKKKKTKDHKNVVDTKP